MVLHGQKAKPNNTGKWSLKKESGISLDGVWAVSEKWKMEPNGIEVRLGFSQDHFTPDQAASLVLLKVKMPQDSHLAITPALGKHRDLVLVIHIRSSYLSPSLSWSPLPQWWPECGHHTSREAG